MLRKFHCVFHFYGGDYPGSGEDGGGSMARWVGGRVAGWQSRYCVASRRSFCPVCVCPVVPRTFFPFQLPHSCLLLHSSLAEDALCSPLSTLRSPLAALQYIPSIAPVLHSNDDTCVPARPATPPTLLSPLYCCSIFCATCFEFLHIPLLLLLFPALRAS